MADTFIQGTDGAGTNLHTFSRTVSAQTVHEQVRVPGIAPRISTNGLADGGNIPDLGLYDTTFGFSLNMSAAGGSGFPWSTIYTPWPYYFYIVSMNFQQFTAGTVNEAAEFEIGLGTDGFYDAMVEQAILLGPFHMHDTADGWPNASATPGGAQEWSGGLRTHKRLGGSFVNFPFWVTTGLPTAQNSFTWTPSKPVRIGPGAGTKLGIYQTTQLTSGNTPLMYVSVDAIADVI